MDRAARIRTGTLTPPPHAAVDPRIHADLSHLRSFEARGRQLSFLPRQPARSVLNGRHASRLRGRGLNFEELRAYLPSDDVRSIDWKVTARTGTPHVRVFTEERDRPALIVVDQRMSMFFGSVLAMKSVTAAEIAALAAWRILAAGDRVGGIVFGDGEIAEFRPARSRRALDAFLAALARFNLALRADAPPVAPMPLNRVLERVARIARRDHLVIVLSDFDGIDETTHRLVAGIARHNDAVLGLVSDPVANVPPGGAPVVVSDGARQAEIDLADAPTRARLAAFSTGRLATIMDWQREIGVPVLPLTSAEDSVSQLRHLLGADRRRP